MHNPFAEVIESSLMGWRAQSWSWDTFPLFGSLLTIQKKDITHIGIVHAIETGSLEAGRYPFAYKKTEEELLEEQPQIFEFLKTSFSCLTIGYIKHNKLYYQLAPQPPKIHAFVQEAPQELISLFFSSHRYLHILFSASHNTINLDELMLAILAYATRHAPLPTKSFEEFINLFSLLTSNDYRRLKLFLQRAEPILEKNISR